MSIRPLRAIIRSAAAVAAALLVSGTVLAHGGETFFVAEPSMVPPGGAVGIRADVLSSGPVRLSLAGTDGTRLEVGVIEQTEDGHFEVFLEIPSDLPPGLWTLLAEADGAPLASTSIEVAGAPIGEAGGENGRDEDDPLLVALPSGWQASRSFPPVESRPAGVATSDETFDLVPIVSLVAAILALTALVVRTRPRRPSEGPSDPSR